MPAELRWLLAAAFAGELPPAPDDPPAVAQRAAEFDLGPRIVARHGTAALAERLGPAAAELVAAHRRAVALGLAGERLAQQIGELAAEGGLEMMILKGRAVELVAPGPPGRRPFSDLDLLLSRQGASRLGERLVAARWRPAAATANPQHLPALVAPEGVAVELHFRLRGVRAGEARWATLAELLAADLCRPLAAGVWLPRPALLAAHLAVHAIEQHGYRPATYPPLRAVADIADLVAAEPGAPLAEAARPLVAESLEDDELDALFRLAGVLAESRLPRGEAAGERGAELLLRHVVAGALDPAYRRGLALDHTTGRLRHARQEGALMRYIAAKLRVPGGEAESASGESTGSPGAIGRRLLRLVRLGARFASSAAARLRRSFDR